MKKKWLSRFLILSLIIGTFFSLLPSSVSAENTTNSSEHKELNSNVQPSNMPTIQCYISKDGVWTMINTISATGTSDFSGQTRNYVSAKTLEDVYGKYGFQVTDLDESPKIFPHASTASSEWAMWCDVDPVKNGDDYYIPLTGTSNSNSIRLYYCPNNKDGWGNYFSTRVSLTNTGAINANSIKTVKYFVAINGAWQELSDFEETVTFTTNEFSDYSSSSGNTRYYVTSDRLEEVYKDYGFISNQFDGGFQFSHATSNDISNSGSNKLWRGEVPVKSNGSYNISLAQYGSYNEINVYYTPDNYFGESATYNDEILLKKESFYSIKIEDSSNILSEEQKSKIECPNEKVYYDKSASITVPVADNIKWGIINPTTGETIDSSTYNKVKNSNSTTTYTFESVTEPITFQCLEKDATHTTIHYNATLSGQEQTIGAYGQGPASSQSIVTDGSVQGATTYTTVVDKNKSYDVLSPDSEYATVSCFSRSRAFKYYFAGWKVKGTEKIFQEESEMTRDDIAKYENEDGDIYLDAVWKLKDSNNRTMSVNFYVGLNSEIRDTEGNGFNAQESSNFSDSIWTSTITGTDNVPNYYNSNDKYQCQILAASTSENAYSVDQALRDSETNPIAPGIAIDSFPSDAEVLKSLREGNYSVTVDGRSVESSELTTDHFTVRWYVLKYHHDDAWHVDGVLVSKEGKMTVKKSFSGDADAIQEIKENGYSITVSHTTTDSDNSSTTEEVDYTLTTSISSTDDSSSATNLGYYNYDEDTQTYTWIITGRQGRTYNIKENNYKQDKVDYVTKAMYRIANSETNTDNSWKTYTDDAEFSVIMPVYESDIDPEAFQSAQFQNTYIKKGKIAFHKIDALTKLGMANISFKLSKEDGADVVLYQDPDHPEQYSADESTAIEEGYTNKLSKPTIKTDASGYFMLKLPSDSISTNYILEEVVPIGYEKQDKIIFKTDSSGNIVGTDTNTVFGFGSKHVTIQNFSKLLTTVIAQKQWEDDVDEDAKLPVTVELWRDGVKMVGDEYTQVLDESNNWTYTWNDLPLFADGQVAQYKLKEVKIGDTKYDMSVNPEGGFADYVISYADPLYKIDSEDEYTHLTGYWKDSKDENVFANSLLLTLTNSQRTAEIEFTKVNENGKTLREAIFGLYSDKECTKMIEQTKSNAQGVVKFRTNKPGTYFIKEIEAPNRYELNENVFTVKISQGVATIISSDGDIITKIVNKKAKVLEPLPDTGGLGLIPQSAVACAVFWCIHKKRKLNH